MKRDDFCIACEASLPGRGLGEVCLKCFQRLKRPVKVMRVEDKRTPATIIVFPTVCAHVQSIRPRHFAVLVLDARHRPVGIEGPFTERQAAREARRIRSRVARAIRRFRDHRK